MIPTTVTGIISICFALAILAILIWNLVYVNNARKSGAANLSKTSGTIIFWIDIILIFVVLGFVGYMIYASFFQKKQEKTTKTVTQETKPITEETKPALQESKPTLQASKPVSQGQTKADAVVNHITTKKTN